MDNCTFCKIAKGEIDTEFLYEDEYVVAFTDIHPQTPIHQLVIPRVHISEFSKLEDDMALSSIRKAVQYLISTNDLEDKGYKLEVNGGGAQLVDHLHFHLMGPITKPQV
jgi:histidine triad (HIT) family protein